MQPQCLWESKGFPDGILASPMSPGGEEDWLLVSRPALLYVLSKDQGSSQDSAGAVLEQLVSGVLVCIARQAKHEWHLASIPPPDPADVQSNAPVFVLGLPKGWEGRTFDDDAQMPKQSRVMRFRWRPPGVGAAAAVGVARTLEPVSVVEALSLAYDHVLG